MLDYISTTSEILFALTSLIVSIIALRISMKISLKRNLTDLQFDLVVELMNDFSRETLFIHSKEIDNEEKTSMSTLPRFKSKSFKSEYSYLFKSKHFLLTNSSGAEFKFLKNQWNPLLPKSIQKELRKFSSYGKYIKKNELNDFTDYVFIDVSPNGDIKHYSLPAVFTDFESFYKYINSVMDKINEWLVSHDAKDIKFDGEPD